MAFTPGTKIAGWFLGQQEIPTGVDLVPIHTPGKMGYDDAGNHYIYAQGNSNVVVGSVCSYSPTTQTVTALPTSGTVGTDVCVSMSVVPTGSYNWFMVQGQTTVLADSGVKAGDTLVVPATNIGYVSRYFSSTPVYQNGTIYGILVKSTSTNSVVTATLRYPFLNQANTT